DETGRGQMSLVDGDDRVSRPPRLGPGAATGECRDLPAGRVDDHEVTAAPMGSDGDESRSVRMPLDPGDVAFAFGDLSLLAGGQVKEVQLIPPGALGGEGE